MLQNFWTPERGFLLPFLGYPICQDFLQGQHLIVSAIGLPPFIYYTAGKMSGTDVDIVDIFSKRMGFTYEVRPDQFWGEIINGTWEGMVGKVLK